MIRTPIYKTTIKDICLLQGDCLELLPKIPNNYVDMVLTDPPYGTTACKWDTVIPFDRMWKQLENIVVSKAPIVLFGSEPFSSHLRISNIKCFKYDWVWKKDAGSNFATVKYQPMKEHELVSIFSKEGGRVNYNPIKQERIGHRKGKETITVDSGRKDSVYGTQKGIGCLKVEKLRYPSSVQYFKRERGLHPTQKPVALLEYLIKTYTNPGQVVLDFTMGSGSTGVACVNTNRKFIGIEKEEKYFKIAEERIYEALGFTSFEKRVAIA